MAAITADRFSGLNTELLFAVGAYAPFGADQRPSVVGPDDREIDLSQLLIRWGASKARERMQGGPGAHREAIRSRYMLYQSAKNVFEALTDEILPLVLLAECGSEVVGLDPSVRPSATAMARARIGGTALPTWRYFE